MNRDCIKELALAHGFKLKPQSNGEMDLNPYVYEFAESLVESMKASTQQLQDQIERMRIVNEVAIGDLHDAKLYAGKLQQELGQLKALTQPLKAFTDAMLAISWQGDDADGATIQQCAITNGLLKEVVQTGPCSDQHCICAEVADFPSTCNRKVYPTEIGPEAYAADVIDQLQFPTVLRKMWSGSEVQQWLKDEADRMRQKGKGGQ